MNSKLRIIPLVCNIILPPFSSLKLNIPTMEQQHPLYGTLNDEARAFHMDVYETIQQVPYGHVSSYGHIACLVGSPRKARQVGYALKHLPTNQSCEFNHTNVPWWRIINSQGRISLIGEDRERQTNCLRQEGVVVSDNSGFISLTQFGWFPDHLS